MSCDNINITENTEMYESLFKSPLKRIFVYGTLKRGEPNYGILINRDNGHAKFKPKTKKYPSVLGEVYDVDSKMLEKLDELEEHPKFYLRTEENIMMTKNESDVNFEQVACVTKAWIYFLPKFKSELLNLTYLTSYSNDGDHGLKYAESDKESSRPEDVM
ncbi:hypothetical protein HCN44_001626 [Aphidius gifuensis]|uniref:Gamma-glutamylcyclotransferase family protein n=1 Tax=Aphidius gifuensis TaxID=684658 RepID=A0A834XU78_APHGI|nr:hypothetical protein HCN44_001626 [Aphidius gifuensis]